MHCEEAISLLPAYMERDLEFGKILLLRQHLQGCTACYSKFGQLEEYRRMLSRNRESAVTAPDKLIVEVMEQVHRYKLQHERRIRLFHRSALIGFLALVGLLLALWLLRSNRHLPA